MNESADPQSSATDDVPAATPAPRPRLRVTSFAGTIAALLLGTCFFVDWVRVDRALGEKFLAGVREALEERDPPTATEKDFEVLGETMVREGALKGTDLIFWVRTAHTHGAQIDAASGNVDSAMARNLKLARVLLYGLPLGAFLLACYFIFHRFRRAKSPVLILCTLVGAAGVVLAGVLNYWHALVTGALEEAASGVSLGTGPKMLLFGGAGLMLAGIFGVNARNWLRVYLGTVLTGLALVLLVMRYLEAGMLP